MNDGMRLYLGYIYIIHLIHNTEVSAVNVHHK